MFSSLGHVFGDTEGVGSRFHILLARTCFRRYGGRRLPFSCFALPDLFSTVPRALALIFMFCAPGLVFGVSEGVGSRFNVLRAQNHFRWYRGRWVPFSYFALPDLFSAVPRASGHVFKFCAPEFVFGGTVGVGTHFHILRSLTHFRMYQGHQVPFSCFALPDIFFGNAEGFGSHFHVFRSLTRFRR
jgi:hypothetical protein